MSNKFIIEVVWNRDFDWRVYSSAETIEAARRKVEDILDSGDGNRVKKARILLNDEEVK